MSILRQFLVLILLLGCPFLLAQEKFLPNTPLKNFKIPVFGDNGYRQWFFQGQEAEYVAENTFDVTGMVIKTFSGDKGQFIESLIRSPSAQVSLVNNTATSSAPIAMYNSQFHITGEGWSWDGKNHKMTIDNNVRIVFNGNVYSLITP